MAKQYTIGEASQLVGLSAKTIRYYESINVLSSAERKENNYRLFSEQDLNKLRLIVEAKSLGIPLSEVKSIVTAAFDEGCVHLKDYLTKRIPEYISQTDEKIRTLQQMKERLSLVQNRLNDQCGECSDTSTCYLYLQSE